MSLMKTQENCRLAIFRGLGQAYLSTVSCFERPSFVGKPSAEPLVKPHSSRRLFRCKENCMGAFEKGK